MGVTVPKTSNANDWMQFLTGSTTTKNSKGLLIKKITNLRARWTSIIVSLCFTPVGQVSDVKMTMIESIGQVFQKVKNFNWSEYLVDIIQTNCKECQEYGKAIKFPSLLIWIEMEQYSPVGEPAFTIKKVPMMEKYRIFSTEQARYFWFDDTPRNVSTMGQKLERQFT
jgi:hypothetical protein